MTRNVLPGLLFAGIAIAAPIKEKGGTRSELEGKWIVKEATTFAGVEQPHLTNTVIVIRGDQFSATSKAEGKGRIKVDEKTNPKRVEFEFITVDGKPPLGQKGRWIYELDGDELRMASFTNSDGGIPEKIDPTDRKQMIWKAKRVKE